MSTRYFAAMDPDELAQQVIAKEKDWDNFMSVSRHYERMRRLYFMLFGQDEDGYSTSKIGQKGDSGQIAVLKPNHLRAAAKNVHALIASQRIALKPRATNTDAAAQSQLLLAESQLDYYMRDKRVERNIDDALWMGIGLGAGYVSGDWDSTLGDTVGGDADAGTSVKSGDMVFQTHLPPDVICDYTAKSVEGCTWHIVREYVNKFELAAKYPQFADDIVSLARPIEPFRKRFELFEFRRERDTDIIPLFRFMHRKTAALPQGRYMTCVSDKTWLTDGPLPFKKLPLFRIAPDTVWGSPFGYTSAFDAASIQQGLETLASIIMTNQKQAGVQSVVARRGHNMDVTEIAKGWKLIEHDSPPGQEPKAMSFTNTPKEIFEWYQTLVSHLGIVLGGMADLARGLGDDKNIPGNLAALRDAQALRFSSGLQHSYKQLCEDVGGFIIDSLQTFATAPRTARIAGKSKSYALQSFSNADLSLIDFVSVETVDPAFATTAGKMQLVDMLAQHGAKMTPQQIQGVFETGRLEVATDGEDAQRIRVKAENEKLMQGQMCLVCPTDNHPYDIAEHAAVWADPTVRDNPQVRAAVWAHLEAHGQVWHETPPWLLGALGIPPPVDMFMPSPDPSVPGVAPPPPPGMPPGPPGPPQGAAPPGPQGPPPGPAGAPALQPPQLLKPAVGLQPGMPGMPRISGQPYNPGAIT